MQPALSPPPGPALTPGDAGRRVWVLRGPKAGDFSQTRALATALGVAYEVKTLAFRRHELLLHLWPRPTRLGLDARASSRLEPPWPDLIITAGRRNELVARWIRTRSGERTRLVHVGRPWSRPERFDLVVATSQYLLAPGGRVLVNDLPLNEVTAARLADAAAAWQATLGDLPRPRLGVLVGGDSGPFVFTPALAVRLAAQLDALVDGTGGSLLLTTSARTPAAFADRLLARLAHRPAHSYRWPSPDPNPYWGYLALADALVVTSESVSMLAEACATGKPVWMFDAAMPGPWWLRASGYRWKPLSHRLVMALGPRRMRRDVGRIHARLLARGRAAWLGQAAPTPAPAGPGPAEDLLRSAAAVRGLLGPGRA